MPENTYNNPIPMVKIDGGKIRKIREQKGLTQLYIATAVQVTTDTISRWENKHYPTIKKENAIKLAEALAVSLQDILLTEHAQPEGKQDLQQDIVPAATTQEIPENTFSNAPIGAKIRKIWPILILSATMFLVIMGFVWVYFSQSDIDHVTATRIMPDRCTPGQPFPVIIEIHGINDKQIALIVKEELPPGAKPGKSSPAASSTNTKNNSLKWLQKVEGKSRFAYSLVVSPRPNEKVHFQGSISLAGSTLKSIPITGKDSIEFSTYHWADSNGDNSISDKEILNVYEQYGDIEALGINLDEIEEMWLGAGYLWDSKKSTYIIQQ